MTVQSLVNEILSRDGRGRKASDVGAVVTRNITAEDVIKMNDTPVAQSASPLKKLKHSHHMLARLVADGVREEEISNVMGYAVAYISLLKNDPAFSQLVKYYAEQKAVKYLDVHERLSTLSMDAVDEIQSRLAETPDSFQVRELKEIAEMGLDRIGYGKQTQVDHKHTVALVDPAQITRMKDDLRSRSLVTPLITAPDSRAEMGEIIDQEPIPEAEGIERLESGGDSLPEEGGEVLKEE